jgi:two-component system, NarL family, sensor kinase
MKKILLLICTIILLNSIVSAQVPDSLFAKLSVAKEDSFKSKLLNKIAYSYGINKSDSAIYYYTELKKHSEKINFQRGVLFYYINITQLYNEMGKLDTSIKLCFEGLDVAKKYGDKKLIANCTQNVGNCLVSMQKSDSGITYLLEAEKIMEQIGDSYGLYILYGNFCGVYGHLEQHEKGKSYALKAVNLYKQGTGQEDDYMYTLSNLAGTYANLNMNDSAKFYANEALVISKKYKAYFISFENLQNILNANINEGNYNNLLPIIIEIQQLKPFLNNPQYNAKLNFDIALSNYYNGNSKNGIFYALRAISICDSSNLVSIAQETYFLLSKMEANLGNYSLADKYAAKRDSLYKDQINKDVANKVQDLEKKYESQKKTSAILKLQSTNKQKSTLNKILIGSAAALLFIGFLGYRNFRSRQKLQQAKIAELEKDKQLLAIDAMLQGQEEERSRIAKDLHDGLGGMLSGTKLSFIHMKENLVLTPENATQFDKSLSMLDNTIADLRKVAHNLMPEALVKFGLQEAVRDFCNSIQSSSNLKVVYQPLGDNRKLSNTAEVFTYRIIQELVNNAVKHANASQIIVQLTTNNNKVGIVVEDDGKGFDTNALANSKGAGMDNIKYRVQYFNGTIDTVTSVGNGTSINIELSV